MRSVDPMTMHDHINGLGLWIVTQLSRSVDHDEFLVRARRAFPEVSRETFERSYDVFMSTAYRTDIHDDTIPVHAVA